MVKHLPCILIADRSIRQYISPIPETFFYDYRVSTSGDDPNEKRLRTKLGYLRGQVNEIW